MLSGQAAKKGHTVDETQSVRLVDTGRMLLIGVVLITVAAALGLFLGNLVTSPDWHDAVRMVLLGALAVVMLMSPLNGLLLWIATVPYAQSSFTTMWEILNIRLPPGIPSLTLARLGVAFLSVIWLAHLAAGRKRMRRLGMIEIAMVAFCVMSIPSVAAGLQGINRSGQILLDRFITPFLVFALAKNLYEEENGLDKFMGALAVIGAYLSFMTFYENLTGQTLFTNIKTVYYSRSLPKIVSLLGNPAFMGTVLAMIAPFALYGLVRGRSAYARALWGGLFLATSVANFACYNRGAWVALIVGLLVLVLFEPKYRRILLPVLLIAALAAFAYWQVLSQSALATERVLNVSSLRFRLTMLEVSREIIQDNPVFGVGVDNFADYYMEYGGSWPTLAYDTPTPHNSFVLLLTTMGLAVLTPYLLIFASIFLRMWGTARRARVDASVDRALLVSGCGAVAVYVVSAAAVDLIIHPFTSMILFLIAGTLHGYMSCLEAGETQVKALEGSS